MTDEMRSLLREFPELFNCNIINVDCYDVVEAHGISGQCYAFGDIDFSRNPDYFDHTKKDWVYLGHDWQDGLAYVRDEEGRIVRDKMCKKLAKIDRSKEFWWLDWP